MTLRALDRARRGAVVRAAAHRPLRVRGRARRRAAAAARSGRTDHVLLAAWASSWRSRKAPDDTRTSIAANRARRSSVASSRARRRSSRASPPRWRRWSTPPRRLCAARPDAPFTLRDRARRSRRRHADRALGDDPPRVRRARSTCCSLRSPSAIAYALASRGALAARGAGLLRGRRRSSRCASTARRWPATTRFRRT